MVAQEVNMQIKKKTNHQYTSITHVRSNAGTRPNHHPNRYSTSNRWISPVGVRQALGGHRTATATYLDQARRIGEAIARKIKQYFGET